MYFLYEVATCFDREPFQYRYRKLFALLDKFQRTSTFIIYCDSNLKTELLQFE